MSNESESEYVMIEFQENENQTQEFSKYKIPKISLFKILFGSFAKIFQNFRKVFAGWFSYLVITHCGIITILYGGWLVVGRWLAQNNTPANVYATSMMSAVFMLSIFGCFVNGFLAYMTDLFQFRSSSYSLLLTGFSRKLDTFLFAIMLVFPGIALTSLTPLIFGKPHIFIEFEEDTLSDIELFYNFFTTLLYFIYLMKMSLVPNFFIAKDYSLGAALKKSWGIVRLKVFWIFAFLAIFFTALLVGIAILFYIFIEPILLDVIEDYSTFEVIEWLSISLIWNVLFVWYVACIANIYNHLFPTKLEFAKPIKQTKYYCQDFVSPDFSDMIDICKEGSKSSIPIEYPKDNTHIGIAYQQKASEEKVDYQTGKTKQVDAVKMMSDPRITYFEASFDDYKHMTDILKYLPVLIFDENREQYDIIEPLCCSVKLPTEKSTGVKLFLGGIDFNEDLFNQSIKVITFNDGVIIRKNFVAN